jgi:type VI secretion system protein VasI
LADKIGVTGGIRKSAPAIQGKGKWNVRVETSPINDSKNVYLSLTSNESIPSMIGTTQPVLLARCKENSTDVFVNWDVYLGMEETDVLSRLDSEPAKTENWSISTDYKATFYGGSDIAFLKQLMNHEKLLLQVTPYGESPVMISFSLSGLPEAIRPLQDACGWK